MKVYVFKIATSPFGAGGGESMVEPFYVCAKDCGAAEQRLRATRGVLDEKVDFVRELPESEAKNLGLQDGEVRSLYD